jgi:hypothetical protein
MPAAAKFPFHQLHKEKIVRLHDSRMEKSILDTTAQDTFDGEDPSLFHTLRMLKRREFRIIREVIDQYGNTHSQHHKILHNVVIHFQIKFQHNPVDTAAIDVIQHAIPLTPPLQYMGILGSRLRKRRSERNSEQAQNTTHQAWTVSAWNSTLQTGIQSTQTNWIY